MAIALYNGMVMMVKIADNVTVSLPVKSQQEGEKDTFLLDSSNQPEGIIRSGQAARVVALNNDQYETVMERKIRSVKWEQEGVQVRLAGVKKKGEGL
jgi:hypothetical protein